VRETARIVVGKKAIRLHAGGRIVFASPSKAPDPVAVATAAGRLRDLGYEVVVPEGICARRGYLAGNDQERAARLNAALLDPEAACVLCMAGGYGVMRILPLLDWERLARRASPPLVVGFSDITALHIALQKSLGWVTFHGPMGMTTWGGADPPAASLAEQFLGALGAGPNPARAFWPMPFMEHASPHWLVEGQAEGRLRGGNLALIAALMGTPWEIDTTDCILFLEDVGEEPYRVDRMLCQLACAGKLRACRGILLGGWTRCEPETPALSLSLQEVFEDHFSGLNVPVLAGWPSGHVPNQLTLPLGVQVRMNAEGPVDGYLTLREMPWAETAP
jgi:muramoyltetrapeptide carboxypeptidase